jgi:hypothetical protein
MKNTIKPIETLYKGYKFRSKLEARWAVFFDTAGVKWEYEPEVYELSTGERYLPDFYLPDEDIFIEIKGEEPNQEYIDKLCRFTTEIKKNVILTIGVPEINPDEPKNLLIAMDANTNDVKEFEINIFINPLTKGRIWLVCLEESYHFITYSDTEKNKKVLISTVQLDTFNNLVKSLLESVILETKRCIDAMKQARFEFQK